MVIPAFFSLLCLSLNGLVDSIFVSECGAPSLIGVGIVQSIFVIIVGMGTGLSIATNSSLSFVISKYNDKEKAFSIIDNSIILTVILGILISVILILILKPLLLALNIYQPAIEPALIYGYILFGGNIFFFFAAVIPSILKAQGEITKTTYALTSTSLLNIVLDYILIHVLGYGVFGAAIATVACSALCCTFLVYFMKKGGSIQTSLSRTFSSFDSTVMKKIFLDSLPITFESFILSLFGFLANIIFNALNSPNDLAAFIAAYKVYTFVVIPIIAISEGNVTIIAYLFGQNKFKTMKSILKYEVKIATAIAIVLWVIIFIFRHSITQVFVTDNNIAMINELNFALPILNLILIIMPLGLISVSILQGTQQYKKSFIVSTIRSVVLEVAFGFIGVFVFHDVFYVYLGIIIGAILGCLISGFTAQRSIVRMENKVK